jgi:hypothetical protein
MDVLKAFPEWGKEAKMPGASASWRSQCFILCVDDVRAQVTQILGEFAGMSGEFMVHGFDDTPHLDFSL